MEALLELQNPVKEDKERGVGVGGEQERKGEKEEEGVKKKEEGRKSEIGPFQMQVVKYTINCARKIIWMGSLKKRSSSV